MPRKDEPHELMNQWLFWIHEMFKHKLKKSYTSVKVGQIPNTGNYTLHLKVKFLKCLTEKMKVNKMFSVMFFICRCLGR